ncbi:OmpP1/FadL family transporter [Neisseria weaveri]|uniref:OmpP1/FadL family transporter n=1 Tax=Neisseria weaveri TaxID=28091 RepID=UPI0002231D73|nr:OmpP1/FadL family transporter [Neisseria weaveri]EGV35612.1 outer membrane transport protein [Neisseria weaveri ATCC 51223]
MKNIRPITLILASAFAANAAYASGYHFGTQSVSSQSTANASAAEASDASTIFYNPAGLTKLENNEITAAINLVSPSVKYHDGKATYNNSPHYNVINSSNSGKITKDLVVAPHVYGAYKINDNLTAGLGVYVPFASSTEYAKDSVLRFNLNKTELTTLAVEPVLAYKFNEQHSVAVGAVAQHSDAGLRKYADWAASKRPAHHIDQLGGVEGHADVKGKDWGFGYHLAWMWDINPQTRVGINYRSHVKHNLKGHAEWSPDSKLAQRQYNVKPDPQNKDFPIGKPISEYGAGYVPNEKASLKIVTPESLSVHGMYQATPKLNLFGDVTWTRHSRFNRAALKFENAKMTISGKPSNETVITPNWRDTYKVAVGASYQYSEPLQLRAGIAYDQSPVRNDKDRLVTMPDNDRIWLSLGTKYDFGKKHTVNAAYSYIHIKDAATDTRNKPANKDVTTVDSNVSSSARFKSHAHILGLQYTYKF